MRFFISFLLAVFIISFSCPVIAGDKLISDELDTPLYNLTVSAVYMETSNKHPLQFALETGVGKREIIVTLQNKQMSVDVSVNGKVTESGKIKLDYTQGKPVEFIMLRRDNWLGILHNETVIWNGNIPHMQGGNAEWRKQTGWTVNFARLQRLEPVIFSDDFMRTADESGQWIINNGNWKLQSAWDKDPKGGAKKFVNQIYAQNPFAWVGYTTGKPAICTVGSPDWENYTVSAAVQAPRIGAVGVIVNAADADNYILVRWSPVTDTSINGNRISIIAVKNGKETIIAANKGGYLPDQWYRLSVVSTMTGIKVLVDGQERLSKDGVTPWRGGAGLYAAGDAGTIFDDVKIYGHSVKSDIMNEHLVAKIAQRFIDDHKGMATWAAAGNDWKTMTLAPDYFTHRFNFYGDHWITMNARLSDAATGQLILLLNGDGINAESGYRAVFKREEKNITVSMYKNSKLLRNSSLQMTTDDPYSIKLRRSGNTVVLDIDDNELMEIVDTELIKDFHPAYSATGCFSVDDVMATGRNLLDYSFTDAPTDWMTEGTWMPTTRWSCSNQWSFLGGWSRGDAAIWHKKRFNGDQFFNAFIGVKMEYPREHELYWTRFRDLAITICGDGNDPRTGYSGVVNATGADGKMTGRTVLLRNGKEVAATVLKLPGSNDGGHTHWFQLELHKEGSAIEFWVDGEMVLSFNDPAPINGGIPAVWTSDNGISLARVRIGSASPGLPRNDRQITIDEPWYPEWGDIGRPIDINFTGVASTDDAAVKLQVNKRIVPDNAAEPVINGMRLTMTPAAAGDYWYQVKATDGNTSSPSFNLALPVFNPALGRNDKDALVLYRYDEGTGNVIRDFSMIKPTADLTINNKDAAIWQPGQGLTIHGPAQIKSAAIPKLMEIAKKKACTIECWISTDTVYAPTYWLGGILAWEHPNEKRNFALGHIFRDVVFSPAGTRFNPLERQSPHFHHLRTGLQHIVLTWDGIITRVYINGNPAGQSNIDWQPGKWSPDAPLIIGSLGEGQPDNGDTIARSIGVALYIMPRQVEMKHAYLGTMYLTAIHRRCMPPNEVKNNYLAGPSAK